MLLKSKIFFLLCTGAIEQNSFSIHSLVKHRPRELAKTSACARCVKVGAQTKHNQQNFKQQFFYEQ